MSNIRNSTERLAALFKALGNRHRLAVLQRLASCCIPGTVCGADEAYRACVGDLGDGLGIAPSTLSHHLKELHHAGLVHMARQGQRTECWVDPEAIEELAAFFADLSTLATEEETDE